MKPTQEQVIAWARESGGYMAAPEAKGTLIYTSQASLERFAALAYEAGRTDENEACAKMFNDNESEILWGSQAASAIRARGEQ